MIMVYIALANNLTTLSTLSSHKDIHEQTWILPDGRTKNQMDHVLMNRRHKSNVIAIRLYKGRDTDSDHYSVISIVQERILIMRGKNCNTIEKWNVEKLKDQDVKKVFSMWFGN